MTYILVKKIAISPVIFHQIGAVLEFSVWHWWLLGENVFIKTTVDDDSKSFSFR
jgi:hypothetical protein